MIKLRKQTGSDDDLFITQELLRLQVDLDHACRAKRIAGQKGHKTLSVLLSNCKRTKPVKRDQEAADQIIIQTPNFLYSKNMLQMYKLAAVFMPPFEYLPPAEAMEEMMNMGVAKRKALIQKKMDDFKRKVNRSASTKEASLKMKINISND